MAHDTALAMRSLVIYQVFPRNHGPSGQLREVTADVDRIAGLGVDVLYLMPIHPIGEVSRRAAWAARTRSATTAASVPISAPRRTSTSSSQPRTGPASR